MATAARPGATDIPQDNALFLKGLNGLVLCRHCDKAFWIAGSATGMVGISEFTPSLLWGFRQSSSTHPVTNCSDVRLQEINLLIDKGKNPKVGMNFD
ncbi:MAG: hypothetical protein AAF412_13500 [Pseudomonadota bacterium]